MPYKLCPRYLKTIFHVKEGDMKKIESHINTGLGTFGE